MTVSSQTGRIIRIAGPVVGAVGLENIRLYDVVKVGELQLIGRTVWGGCVGHNCRIGADLTVYPCRTIESDSVLIRSDKRAVIAKNVSYEESDHHHLRDGDSHQRLYPRDQ